MSWYGIVMISTRPNWVGAYPQESGVGRRRCRRMVQERDHISAGAWGTGREELVCQRG